MTRSATLLIVALPLLVATRAAAETPHWIAELAERLFLRVSAVPGSECPDELDRIGEAASAVCGRYTADVARLKKSLERFDDKPNPAVVRHTAPDSGPIRGVQATKIFGFHRDWRRLGALRVRDWLEDDELVVIAFHETTGTLAVLPKDSCLDPEVRARDDLYFDGPSGFEAARILEDPSPSAPSRSPNGLRKGGDARRRARRVGRLDRVQLASGKFDVRTVEPPAATVTTPPVARVAVRLRRSRRRLRRARRGPGDRTTAAARSRSGTGRGRCRRPA